MNKSILSLALAGMTVVAVGMVGCEESSTPTGNLLTDPQQAQKTSNITSLVNDPTMLGTALTELDASGVVNDPEPIPADPDLSGEEEGGGEPAPEADISLHLVDPPAYKTQKVIAKHIKEGADKSKYKGPVHIPEGIDKSKYVDYIWEHIKEGADKSKLRGKPAPVIVVPPAPGDIN